ncbi:MAG: DUF1367 family protein [Gallionella sp.]|nr:DUF1367 family protein [Gallionella sp.]
MSQINILRTDMELPDMEAAGKFLFGALDGFTREDRAAWRRFWKRLKDMEPGEMARVEAVVPRNGKFHRKFFALLTVGFEHWQSGRKHKTYKGRPVQKNFETFREDITVLAGFYEQHFDVRGNMVLKAKSISFAKMDDIEFERLYNAVADVLLAHVLTTYAGRDELDEIVEKVMRFNV